MVCQFLCVEHCPDWAPVEMLEVTDDDDTTAICATQDRYDAQKRGLGLTDTIRAGFKCVEAMGRIITMIRGPYPGAAPRF